MLGGPFELPFGPRPLPFGSISPSAFMAREIIRTMLRLIPGPGQTSSISEMEKGSCRLKISARTQSLLTSRLR